MLYPITAIYTDIGRGHPNYLDSVLRYIRLDYPKQARSIRVLSVLNVSNGLSRLSWKAIRGVYRTGSRGGLVSSLYTKARTRRTEYHGGSLFSRLLRRDLLNDLGDDKGICLVAHPLLANMVKQRHRVFYLHGEIAAPRESAVRGAQRVYVPLPETRQEMSAMGVSADSLMETGLVLEPEICGNLSSAVSKRIDRIQSSDPPAVGFFISGAYPRRHVEMIVLAVKSCFTSGFNVRVFWGSDSRQASRLQRLLRDYAADIIIDDASTSALPDGRLIIVTAKSREEETIRSMEYLPSLDLFCAAPHERVNWAVGAGLPMVMITPTIGPFASGNRDFVLQWGCGVEFSGRSQFAGFAQELRGLRDDGQLLRMVNAGRQITEVHGAKTIAEDLLVHL